MPPFWHPLGALKPSKNRSEIEAEIEADPDGPTVAPDVRFSKFQRNRSEVKIEIEEDPDGPKVAPDLRFSMFQRNRSEIKVEIEADPDGRKVAPDLRFLMFQRNRSRNRSQDPPQEFKFSRPNIHAEIYPNSDRKSAIPALIFDECVLALSNSFYPSLTQADIQKT